MKRSMLVLAALAAVAGCGGTSVTRYDGAANGGTSGGPGGSGPGGSARTGAAGSGGATGATCPVGERTPDITDCAEFANTGASVTTERGISDGDGGIYLPGGMLSTPAGGTLIDGDYELVRAVWGTQTSHTRRTIRLSASGTYSEWVVDQDSTDPSADGGVAHVRVNATWTISGAKLTVTRVGCGTLQGDYAYTASGDEFDLYNFAADAVFVYKRTCVRR